MDSRPSVRFDRECWNASLMRFARGTLGTLLALAFGLAASVVLNRLLGAEGRGAYAVAVKTAGLVVAWAQWGMPEVMLYSFGEHRAHQGRLLGTALLVVAASSLVGGAGFLAAYPYLADSFFRGVSPLMFAASVASSLFAVAFMIQRRVVQLRGELLTFNLLDVAKSALFLALVVLFVVTLTDEREGAVMAFLSAEVLMAAAGAAFIWWRVERRWQVDLRLARELMRSGLVVQIGILAIFLAGQMGTYIVNLFGTLADVGYYATALGLATYVTFVSVSVRTVLQARMPALFERPDALAELTVVVARHALIWLLVAAAALAVVAGPAITILYGVEFAPAYQPLVLLLPGMVCYGLQQIVASYFTARRQYRTPAVGSWVVALVGLGLQVIAMPLLGVSGAAAALSLGYAAAYLFYLMVFIRSTGHRSAEFLPGPEEWRYYVALARQVAVQRGLVAHSR